MKIIGIIPARYDSVRFPGKALADICGKPMIQHVYERASQVALFEQVIVATDDVRIQKAVTAFGGNACMTSRHHATGTDRLAEVAQSLDVDIVVNIQGDEPLVHPEMIEQAIHPLLSDSDVAIGTLKHIIESPEELLNPNVTKVVTDMSDRAIYFSRSPIPYIKGKDMRNEGFHEFTFYRHIGLYAYRREFLLKFIELAHTPLEIVEALEQLRALEHGYIIKVIETSYESIGVDVPEDVDKVVKLMRNLRKCLKCLK
jgi:3-deoxy-manno-octulosonate cytidylyltransferase (CMP-KDO synthetase)